MTTEWSCPLIRVLCALHWIRQRMKWKESESNECSVAQEEKHLTSSEGKNGGNTERTQKLRKGCRVLLLVPLGGENLLSPVLKNLKISGLLFLINLCRMFWVSMACFSLGFLGRMFAFISCATLCSHESVFYFPSCQYHLSLFCGLFLLSFELKPRHKTAPENRSVPILRWICCIILDRSIFGKIMANILPVPEFPHQWNRWGTSYFFSFFYSSKQIDAGESWTPLLFQVRRAKYTQVVGWIWTLSLMWLTAECLDFQTFHELNFFFSM